MAKLQAAPGLGAPAEELVEVTVFRGMVYTDDGQFGPGKTLRVTASEAARFKACGTVKPDDWQAPADVQTGGLKIVASDGPSIGVA